MCYSQNPGVIGTTLPIPAEVFMETAQVLIGSYNYGLVAVSVLIALLAAYAALDLAGRITATHGLARASWLGGGAFALGLGIWSMHYVGMEALRLPVRVLY